MFEYDCELDAGFVMDPNAHLPFGYIVALDGFGLGAALAKDLQVHLPFNTGAAPDYKVLDYTAPTPNTPAGVVKVVGVIDNFKWNGGAADPIELEFYVSQENATDIMAIRQSALKTTLVKSLGWWIADYDQEVKQWFEQAYPLGAGTITGHINNRKAPVLTVDMHPVNVKGDVDVNVYKIKLAVVPAGKTKYKLHFASSHQKKVIRSWGVLISS